VKALSFEVTTGVGGTGICRDSEERSRPDRDAPHRLDALPMQEDRPFAGTATTKNDAGETVSVAHMCGRPAHVGGPAPPNSWRRTANTGMGR
jgi:hippurate hydrolase